MNFELSTSLEEALCDNCVHKDECEYAQAIDDNAKCETLANLEKKADDEFKETMRRIGHPID